MPPIIEHRVAKFSAVQMTAQVTETAVKTAKLLRTTEERLERRVRAVVRVTVATLFLGISSLIALGANVTTAFAKKMSDEKGKHHSGLRMKRIRVHGRYRHVRHRYTQESVRSSSQLRGIASWYGKEFHGKRTASGATFDTHAMMAAHRTLPFGTKVLVTNLTNGKTCVVQIADRGPYAQGRIIDLSMAAAEALGMTESGVANVELHVLGMNEPNRYEDLATERTPSNSPLAVDRVSP